MRKYLSFLLFSSLLANSGVSAAFAERPNELNSSGQEMLVLYKNDEGKEKILETGNAVDYQYKNIKAIAVKVDPSDIKELKKDPNIADVEPNVSFTIKGATQDQALKLTSLNSTGPTVSSEESQWDFQAMNGPAMLRQGITGKGVKVAVIDTGIASHFDVKIAGGTSTVGYTTSYSDDNGHGTNVAGIIGALHNGNGVIGVASDAQLYAVKVLDKNGSGNLLDITKGIDWAITNHMDIINMSLGTTADSPLLHDMVDKAYKAGILVVAAAGNDSGPVNYPANYDSVIAVSAVDSSKNIASFSSRGDKVEVSAPGVDIYNLYNNGGYVYMSGTSQASPHIAGFLADLKQMHPEMTAAELRVELSKYTEDLGDAGHDSLYGYGFVQYMSIRNAASNSDLLLQQQVADATQQVALAEQSRYDNDIQSAQSSIDVLPDGSDKDSLQARLNRLIQSIQAEIALQKKTQDATDAVGLAETDPSDDSVNSAQQLIGELPAGTAKQGLQNRLDDVLSFLNNKRVQEVEDAVAAAEKTQLIRDIDAAQKSIDGLPLRLGKEQFQNRLNALVTLVGEEEKISGFFHSLNRAFSLNELTDLKKKLALSRFTVENLPDTETKTSLLIQMSSLETKIELREKLLNATDLVMKAEKSGNSSSFLYSAQLAIDAIPSGSDRVSLQKRLDAVKAEIALKLKITAAAKAVAAAEKYKLYSTISFAQVKIRALPAGKTKTALQNRLNTVIYHKKR